MAVAGDKARVEMFLTREEDTMFMVTVMGEFENAHYLALAEVAGEQVINKLTRQYIDQCAADFRYLCKQTSIIAQPSVKGFCDKTICFFSQSDCLRKSRRKILQIAERVEQVSLGYYQMKAYCLSLSTKMKFAKRKVANGLTGFDMKFESAHKTAETMKTKPDALNKFDQLDANRTSHKKHGWIPLVGQLGMLMNEYGRDDTKNAEATEEDVLENFSKAQRLVKGAKHLEEFLEKVASIAELMALFWFFQSRHFSCIAEKMGELDEALGEGYGEDEVIAQEIVEELTESREQFLKYGMIAARACTTSNFDVESLEATHMKDATEIFFQVRDMLQISVQ